MAIPKKLLSAYFKKLGAKGGAGCSAKKLAHLNRLAESRRKDKPAAS